MMRTREEVEAELAKIDYHDVDKPFIRGAKAFLEDMLVEGGAHLAEEWLDGETEELFEEDTND